MRSRTAVFSVPAIVLLLFTLGNFGCRRATDPDNIDPRPGWKRAGPQATTVPDRVQGWELKPPRPDAAPVAAKTRFEGIYPVGSRLPDKEAIGGFGPCDNYSFDLGGKEWGMDGEVSLVAFPDEPVAYFKYRGIAVRLINRTGETASFPACDSRLFLVQEARDSAGRWQAIEVLPESDCGNSFHRVFIKPNQYWQFPARVYGGPLKTKIRFRLDRGGEGVLYSNEFDGTVDAVQFQERPAAKK
jgi:hypothetical protein